MAGEKMSELSCSEGAALFNKEQPELALLHFTAFSSDSERLGNASENTDEELDTSFVFPMVERDSLGLGEVYEETNKAFHEMMAGSADSFLMEKDSPSARGKRKWTTEEDDMLLAIMREPKRLSYGEIAAKIASSTGTTPWSKEEVSERWRRVLQKKQGAWSATEDEKLMLLHAEYGNRWALIAKMMTGGYSDQQVKYRIRHIMLHTRK